MSDPLPDGPLDLTRRHPLDRCSRGPLPRGPAVGLHPAADNRCGHARRGSIRKMDDVDRRLVSPGLVDALPIRKGPAGTARSPGRPPSLSSQSRVSGGVACTCIRSAVPVQIGQSPAGGGGISADSDGRQLDPRLSASPGCADGCGPGRFIASGPEPCRESGAGGSAAVAGDGSSPPHPMALMISSRRGIRGNLARGLRFFRARADSVGAAPSGVPPSPWSQHAPPHQSRPDRRVE